MCKNFSLIATKKPLTRRKWDIVSIYFSIFEWENLHFYHKNPFSTWQLVNFITQILKSKNLSPVFLVIRCIIWGFVCTFYKAFLIFCFEWLEILGFRLSRFSQATGFFDGIRGNILSILRALHTFQISMRDMNGHIHSWIFLKLTLLIILNSFSLWYWCPTEVLPFYSSLDFSFL